MTEKDTVWTEREWAAEVAKRTGRIVRPIRAWAWADYDEWSVYAEKPWFQDAWHRVDVPKGGGHGLRILTAEDIELELLEIPGLVEALKIEMTEPYGPLRSLRVQYENGYELQLERTTRVLSEWSVQSEGVAVAEGDFLEDKDSEAVERSLIAAAAWFTQAEGL